MRTLISKGRVSLPIFTAALALAITFTLSCSNDDNSPQPPKSGEVSYSSSYGGSSDSKALCSNESYDTSIYRCEMGELIGKCRGNDYYVAYERCIDGVVVNNNSNNNSSSSSITSSSSDTPQSSSNIVHNSSSVVPSSSSEAISSSSSMLSSSSVCTAANNTSTEYCSNGTMKQYGFVTYAGQTYKTIEIGEQTWMAENLNYNVAGSEYVVGSKCYDNLESNCTKHGKLYSWATAMNLPSYCNSGSCDHQVLTKHRGICPLNWHVPSDAEWTVLTNYVGSSACKKLKARSGWNNDGNGTDDYGFTALGGGCIYSGSGIGCTYAVPSTWGYWWSATDYPSPNPNSIVHGRRILYSYEEVERFDTAIKRDFFSVRCVKD